MTPPKVSVIIPAFNAAATILRAVESAQRQTCPPHEIIVVDDGSTDGTADSLRGHSSNVKLASQSNAGPASARNRGASLATGEYLAFLDSDDQWHVDKTRLQLEALAAAPSAALCCTGWVVRNELNDPPFDATARLSEGAFRTYLSFEEIFVRPYLATPTVLMSKRVFEASGGFDQSLTTGEDVDLWLRVTYGKCAVRLTNPLVCVNKSSTSLTARTGPRSFQDNLVVIERFAQRRPDFASGNRSLVHAARAQVLTGLGSFHLTCGENSAARRALVAALRERLSWRAVYLLLRSFTRRFRA